MVMEASPSPQSVGREFVRQYYTLLNKAPAHLHRFYNNYSSFVHGGLEAPSRETPPVIGQKQIHNRIQQLNFCDCHAKISQVDSQATLGNGVVVQVTGELSNGGAPMRRFTQTFVLAAQSPKKYYVHNDIFRYQDIVFSEEDGSGDSARSEDGSECAAPSQPPPAALPTPYFPPAAPYAPLAAPPAHLNGHPPAVPPPQQQQDEVAQLAHAMQAGLVTPLASAVAGDVVVEVPQALPEPEEMVEEREPSPEPPAAQPPMETVVPPSAPEPKTYANLLKSGGSVGYHQQPQPRPAAQQATVTPRPAPPPAVAGSASPPESAAPAPQRPRAPRPARQDNAVNDAGPGPTRRYSDSQQLFLGKIPVNATEDELRALFGRFGTIAELRVLTKPAGRENGNYGFITYEDPQSAQNCLNAGSLYFPPDTPNAQKLNVEEKKTRAREGGGGPAARGPARGGARAPRPPFTARAPQPYRR